MMSDLPNPNDVRARMANIIQREVHAMDVREGRRDPLPLPGEPAAAVPPPAPAPAAPAPAPAAPAAAAPAAAPPAPAAAPEAVPAGLEDLIGPNGKYRTVEDFKKGFWHLTNTLSSVSDEVSVLRNQLQTGSGPTPRADAEPAVIPGSTPGARPRVNPVAPSPVPSIDWSKNPSVQKVSEESGVPVEALSALANELAAAGAAAAEARIAPVLQKAQIDEANSLMNSQYPNAHKHLQEVRSFIATNPRVGQTVATLLQAGDYFGAMQHGYTQYLMATGIQAEAALKADSAAAEAARVDARANAGQPSSPNTGVHAAIPDPNARPTAEQREAAVARIPYDGGVAARRLFLGHMLPPEMRTWENQ